MCAAVQFPTKILQLIPVAGLQLLQSLLASPLLFRHTASALPPHSSCTCAHGNVKQMHLHSRCVDTSILVKLWSIFVLGAIQT
jgi:hypothetical protein